MKNTILIVFVFLFFCKTAAQQNWVAVPCFQLKAGDAIGRILYNEAHNEIILCSYDSYKICNSTYKGFFAYNGITFHDMDFGIEAQNPNPSLGYSAKLNSCVEWNGKAIINGGFSTVGSDTLICKNIALWNGTKWDTFPHPFWNNRTAAANTNAGISKLLKDNGKIWMFTGYDTSQSLTFIPVLFDGSNFTSIPQIPVNTKNSVGQAVKYKNKLIVSGNFYNYPSYTFNKLAQFDGTNWSEMGIGVRGSLTGVGELAVYKDTLYIAGNFSKADGNAGNYIMKWDGSQLTDAGFGSWCGYGPVRKLLTYRNRLYALGGFNCAQGKKAYGVAYYENGKWTVPQDSIENGVYDAVVYNDAIYIGGQFNWINGDSTVHQFAKLACPDFDAASGCLSGLKDNYKNLLNLKVFPNPANDKIFIEADFQMKIQRLHIINAIGQIVYSLQNPESKMEIDIAELPKGIYFLKAENEHGQSVFKVVKE